MRFGVPPVGTSAGVVSIEVSTGCWCVRLGGLRSICREVSHSAIIGLGLKRLLGVMLFDL